MSSASVFGLYTARFPYLEASEDKIRPVIVLSRPYGQHNIVTVVPVSSKTKKEPVDIAIVGWRQTGLNRPSVARVHRLSSLLQSNLTSQLGSLNGVDIRELRKALRQLLDL